ncbi:MAG: Ig-like domain-containing protein, partial [Anaerolineae bacterium]|nr:Ig-like domain-containing protein [Anaerolineae bacterium]
MANSSPNVLLKRLLLVLTLAATLACNAVASLMPDGATPTPSGGAQTLPDGTDTPEPLDLPPYPPPKLLFRKPEVNEALAVDESVELVFDQPMDQSSVLDAFEIEPAVDGELTWADARTLRFLPSSALDRGETYQVTVGEGAQNTEGKSLLEPVRFDFQTAGYLQVTEVQPRPGSKDVDPDTTVTVIFNRPVVPLTSLDAQAELPDAVTFVPTVRGTGEWLTTSIYRFEPEEGFTPATNYTARLVSGLQDTTGATMESGYSWTFTTLSPDVLAWAPEDNAEHVGPSAVISVTFNQPMDHASTEAAFRLAINDRPVEGSFV